MNIAAKNLLQASAIMLCAFFTGQLVNSTRAEGTTQVTDQSIKYVGFNELNEAIATGDSLILDARSVMTFNKGHIPTAVNLPAQSPATDIQQVVNRMKQTPKRVIVYCSDANCNDSHALALRLTQAGVENVHIYKEGWEEWEILAPTN
jgi:3-mercaptopyruvate sulfurtransferase SseA